MPHFSHLNRLAGVSSVARNNIYLIRNLGSNLLSFASKDQAIISYFKDSDIEKHISIQTEVVVDIAIQAKANTS